MTIDFYTGQPPEHIGHAVYNYPDGMWDECHADVSHTALTLVAQKIDAGDDYGYVYDHKELTGLQYVRRTNHEQKD